MLGQIETPLAPLQQASIGVVDGGRRSEREPLRYLRGRNVDQPQEDPACPFVDQHLPLAGVVDGGDLPRG